MSLTLLFCAAVLLKNGYISIAENAKRRPNVLFIMADDYGWNDVSWHNKDMPTPFLQSLATHHAVILNQSYVNQKCTPTRSAFFTATYPFHLGTEITLFEGSQAGGVPLRFTFLSEYMQRLDYKTYMIGKWHLGYCNHSYIPYGRGFDYFYGFYGGSEDYYTHIYGNRYRSGVKYRGIDLWDGLSPVLDKQGVYSTDLFTNKTIEAILNHDTSKNFFIYLAFQAVHAPLEVPKKYLDPCKRIKNNKRRTYCGMVNAMDTAIGRVVQTLKDVGVYNETIIIVSSDNGGQTLRGGNNYPLRGNKNTLWEGGNRAISFVHSPQFLPALPSARNQLFSIVDWFPTILTAVGKRTDSFSDGVNQWDMILHNNPNQRSGLVYNIYKGGAAIRKGRYKLIIGNPGRPSGWIPPPTNPNKRKRSKGKKMRKWKKKLKTPLKGPWLFDLKIDPTEHINLAAKFPRKVRYLKSVIAQLRRQTGPSMEQPPDPRGDPRNFNGTMATGWC